MPDHPSCDCALRFAAIERRLSEQHADVVAELQELRRLLERPSANDHATRLYVALSALLDADDPFFMNEDVFDLARTDAELTAALDALGLQESRALGYWLRSRVGRDLAGFAIVRDGRGWRMEPCR